MLTTRRHNLFPFWMTFGFLACCEALSIMTMLGEVEVGSAGTQPTKE
jgi:hypothetical protein